MKAKELIRELKKIVKQYNKDIDVNILVDKGSLVEIKKIDYNPKYGGDGIILE